MARLGADDGRMDSESVAYSTDTHAERGRNFSGERFTREFQRFHAHVAGRERVLVA